MRRPVFWVNIAAIAAAAVHVDVKVLGALVLAYAAIFFMPPRSDP